jgi:predicted TIM-barrel fold metal-dependent hydrolase
MSPARTYTPELARITEIKTLHRALKVDRVIIVQPTIYGTDNACTMDAVRRLGERARGVAVADESTSMAELDEMERSSFRGVRINLGTVGMNDPEVARQRFKLAVEQVRNRAGWHIQIYTHPPIIEALYDLLVDCPVVVAFDHFGGVKMPKGMQEKGFGLLLDLLRAGKAYVKLSAPYLASRNTSDYPDLLPLTRALLAANLERVLWGTNWPHPNAGLGECRKITETSPLRQIDDGYILNLLPLWVPKSEDRKTILVDNPARLYGY